MSLSDIKQNKLEKVVLVIAFVIATVTALSVLPIGGVFQPIVIEQIALIYLYPLFLAIYFGIKSQLYSKKELLITALLFLLLACAVYVWRKSIPFSDLRFVSSVSIIYSTIFAALPYSIRAIRKAKLALQFYVSYILSVAPMAFGSSIT
jgi:hypothetical protein